MGGGYYRTTRRESALRAPPDGRDAGRILAISLGRSPVRTEEPRPMFPPVHVAEIARHEGQEVTLHGWLHGRRSSGKLHFLQLRDGTGTIQCVVFKGNVSPEVFQEADHLPQETSLAVTGLVKKDERSPIGHELDVRDLRVFARPAREFPLGHKEHGVAFLMEQRHLWLRSPRQQLILRVRHTVEKAIRDFFDGRGFTLVDAPIFTPAACEEKSKTRRHLTEFWMVEPEVAYMDLDGDMALMEEFVSHVVQTVLARHEKELASVLERDVEKLRNVKPPFPRIT